MTNDKELLAYRKKVEHYYNKPINEELEYYDDGEFENSSIAHAEIVVEFLFKLALETKQDIKILTGRLDGEFYNKFLTQATKVLQTNKISIVTLNGCDDSDFKTAIQDSPKGEITESSANQFSKISHFLLVGDNAYRSEKHDLLKTAYVSFDNKFRGEFLSVMFDYIKSKLSANQA